MSDTHSEAATDGQSRDVDAPLARIAAEVTVRDWSWRFNSRNAWTLEEVSLRFLPGERVLVLGASGSGKSTLLRAIAGVLGDGEDGESAGKILIDGLDARDAHHRVGMVFQDPDSQVMLSRVGDDVAFGCENLGVQPAEIGNRVDAALAAVSLDVPLNYPTERLSGGQKQRLALAGVLAMQPSLLLLDEPTALLDPAGVREVRDALHDVTASRAHTVIIVEHRVDVWLDYVDRVIVLSAGGEVVLDGPPLEVLTHGAERLRRMGVWFPDSVPENQPGPENRPVSVALGLPEPVPVSSQSVLHGSALQFGWHAKQSIGHIADIELHAGRVLAITGPNGAGKTTLALTLGGVIAPLSGDITVTTSQSINGQPITGSPITWTSRELATRIGSVFQIPEHQFVSPTVRDELSVNVVGAEHAPREQDARIADLAKRFRLDHLFDANPFTLSGGEQRRLSVASALASSPEILILDEPTFGQDALTWQAMVEQIEHARQRGCAIAIVTHDERLVSTLADDVVRIDATHSSIPNADAAVEPAPRMQTVSPLAKLAAATVISLGLIVTLDWVSASMALLLELALLPMLGLKLTRLVKLLVPLAIAALLAGLTTALYGRPSGEIFFDFALIHVTQGSISLAIATSLRILAIALPAVVLFATVDPTDLADSLEQRTKLSPRFVIGALVALRLLTLISDDWQQITRARRARGIGDQPRLVQFPKQAFALFVMSLRRADKLAAAMQARGFGGSRRRTWSRTAPFGTAEIVLIAVATLLVTLALGISIATGHFTFVFGGV